MNKNQEQKRQKENKFERGNLNPVTWTVLLTVRRLNNPIKKRERERERKKFKIVFLFT